MRVVLFSFVYVAAVAGFVPICGFAVVESAHYYYYNYYNFYYYFVTNFCS